MARSVASEAPDKHWSSLNIMRASSPTQIGVNLTFPNTRLICRAFSCPRDCEIHQLLRMEIALEEAVSLPR